MASECKAVGHQWVEKVRTKGAEHQHMECLRCGTRGVVLKVRAKSLYDVAWVERRDEPPHPTAGDPVITRIG